MRAMPQPPAPETPKTAQARGDAPLVLDEEYYARLKSVESAHWWTLGMTDVMTGLLRARQQIGAALCPRNASGPGIHAPTPILAAAVGKKSKSNSSV